MTIHLSIVLWLPLAAGLLALLAPRAAARWVMLAGALLTLAYAITIAADYSTSQLGLQYVTDETWIATLGIHYKLGVGGLNVVLLLTTAVVFARRRAVGGAARRAGRAARPLRAADGPRAERRDGRVPGAGPRAVRRLLRRDAGAVLLPHTRLGHGPREARPCRPEAVHLHARRLAADARRRDRDRRPGRRWRTHDIRAQRPAREPRLVRARRTGSSSSSRSRS